METSLPKRKTSVSCIVSKRSILVNLLGQSAVAIELTLDISDHSSHVKDVLVNTDSP
jgi:hypothetical protein